MKNIIISVFLSLFVTLDAMRQENAPSTNTPKVEPILCFKGHPNFNIKPNSDEQVLLDRIQTDGGIEKFVNEYKFKNKLSYQDLSEAYVEHLNMIHAVIWAYREWRFRDKTPDFLINSTVLTILLLMPEINSFGCMWQEGVNFLDIVIVLAIQKDYVNALRYLHQYGANIYNKAIGNKTLVHCACKYRSENCLRYLLEHDVDPLCKTLHMTETGVVNRIARDKFPPPLKEGSLLGRIYNMLKEAEHRHASRRALRIQHIQSLVWHNKIKDVEEVFEQDAEFLDEQDDNGWTPLMWAAVLGNLPMVQLFVKFKARLFLKSKRNYTALDMALWKPHKEIVEYLEPIINKKLEPSWTPPEECLIS